MFASMSTFRGSGVDLAGAAKAAGETMEAWLRQFEGYLGIMIVTNQEIGTAHAITFWESAEAAAQSQHGRTRMREQMAASIGVELVGNEHYAISYIEGRGPFQMLDRKPT